MLDLAFAGFTLLELLLVIAVVSLLAAVVFPAFSQSKQAGRRVQCVSNLHQLSLAAEMFWQDNDGGTFRYRGVSTNNGDLFWFGWLQRGAEGQRLFDPTQGALYPYFEGRGVEVCPSLRYGSPTFKFKADGAAYGYGVNLHLTGPSLASIGTIERPADVIGFADAAQINTFQTPASPDHPLLEEFYYVSTNRSDRTAHFRHDGWANATFCDGHIECLHPEAGSLDPRLPEERVGRLPDENLRPF